MLRFIVTLERDGERRATEPAAGVFAVDCAFCGELVWAIAGCCCPRCKAVVVERLEVASA